MKISIRDLKLVINEAFFQSSDWIVLSTRDGIQWEGSKSQITSALIRFGASNAERNAILSGAVPISSTAASSLKSQGALQKVPRPMSEPKPYDWGKADRVAEKKRSSLVKAYHQAIKEFIKPYTSFRQESPDTNPEDATPDLADNFFHEYPQWRDWARALDMSRSGMKGAIADYVYDAMMKGK